MIFLVGLFVPVWSLFDVDSPLLGTFAMTAPLAILLLARVHRRRHRLRIDGENYLRRFGSDLLLCCPGADRVEPLSQNVAECPERVECGFQILRFQVLGDGLFPVVLGPLQLFRKVPSVVRERQPERTPVIMSVPS